MVTEYEGESSAKVRKFVRADAVQSNKPDAKGTVIIKIILMDERKAEVMHKAGNRKEEIALDDTTVGEVYTAVKAALLGD